MRYHVEVGERTIEVDPTGPRVDGREVAVSLSPAGVERVLSLLLDGRSYTIVAVREGARGEWAIEVNGVGHRVVALNERSKAIREMAGAAVFEAGAQEVVAPMPGLVIEVYGEVGMEVSRGDALLVLEAMKMENEVQAEVSGRIEEVRTSAGQKVDKGTVLFVIEPGETVDGGGPDAEQGR